jgi:hypothetical protein
VQQNRDGRCVLRHESNKLKLCKTIAPAAFDESERLATWQNCLIAMANPEPAVAAAAAARI